MPGMVQVVRNLREMGRELAFWGDVSGVLKRISARNLKNTIFPSKNVVWRSKSTIFEKNGLRKKIGDPKLHFRRKFYMILHGFAWRSSKNIVLRPRRQKNKKQFKKYVRNRLYSCLQGALHPALSYSLHWKFLAIHSQSPTTCLHMPGGERGEHVGRGGGWFTQDCYRFPPDMGGFSWSELFRFIEGRICSRFLHF